MGLFGAVSKKVMRAKVVPGPSAPKAGSRTVSKRVMRAPKEKEHSKKKENVAKKATSLQGLGSWEEGRL